MSKFIISCNAQLDAILAITKSLKLGSGLNCFSNAGPHFAIRNYEIIMLGQIFIFVSAKVRLVSPIF